MLPGPPESALFPYTTLFRSHVRPGLSTAARRSAHRDRAGEGRARTAAAPTSCPLGGGLRQNGRTRARDRKSTRLNSSHITSSYAAFCLKKKRQLRGLRPCEC